MKKILFISDKDKKFNHSFIENVINGYLKEFFEIFCVYFDNEFKMVQNDIYLLKTDRKNALKVIQDNFLDLKKVDFIIVRNFLDVLKSAIKAKKIFGFKLYFQLSFPHFYRSYHEAKLLQKNVFFKFIKYKINLFLYTKFINKCDGFFPISKLMKDEFFKNIKVKYLSIPLGINEKQTKWYKPKTGAVKFIYIGAIDINRNLDYFFSEFVKSKSNFILEIYTKDYEYAKTILPNDKRIVLHNAVEKDILFDIMQDFDVGCFYVPVNKLYNLSSPTKVMDYYACSVVSLSSKINECVELFDDKSIFFIDNNIKDSVDKICQTPREQLHQMAKNGLNKLLLKRNYRIIAENIRDFL